MTEYTPDYPKVERMYCIAKTLGALECAVAAVRAIAPDGVVITDYDELRQIAQRLSGWQIELFDAWDVIKEGIDND